MVALPSLRMRMVFVSTVFALLVLAATAVPAQPENDNCEAAILLGPEPTSGTTLGATTDGDATCAVSSDSPDVWYTYEATDDVILTATLCNPGTDYDTAISFHDGCPGDRTNQLVCNDDDLLCTAADVEPSARASTVSLELSTGSTTWIRISGFNGAVGNFTLRTREDLILGPPANDACDEAHPVGPGTYFGTTEFATNDGDSSCPPNSISPDVWYSYTPSTDGFLTLGTCDEASDFDTALSMHTGCPGDTSNEVACNDDDPLCEFDPRRSAIVDQPVTAGTTYLIRVHSFLGVAGKYGLSVNGPSAAGFALSYSGSCPGATTIDALGGTPDGLVAFLIDDGTGDFGVPFGNCLGIETDVSGVHAVAPVFTTADANGDASIAGEPAPFVCGSVVQAVDLTNCTVSSLGSVD